MQKCVLLAYLCIVWSKEVYKKRDVHSNCSVCLGQQRGYIVDFDRLGGNIHLSDCASGGSAILNNHVSTPLAAAAWQHAEAAGEASD